MLDPPSIGKHQRCLYNPTLLLTCFTLYYCSRLETVTPLRFAHSEAKGTSKKLKQFSQEEIEVSRKRQDITVPLDVESTAEKDARSAKEECNGQAVEFGNHLPQHLFGRSSVVQTPGKTSVKGDETVLQIGDCMESSAQRRSRKGTPFRRARNNFTREKKENDEWSVTNGLVGRRSSPVNGEHDSYLSKRPEHTMKDTCSEPELAFHIWQGGGHTKHSTLQKESDLGAITDEEESQEDLIIAPPTLERACQNGNCIQFVEGMRKSLDENNASLFTP